MARSTAALPLALSFLLGCATEETLAPAPSPDEVATYVGALAGTDALVAVATDGDGIAAYVCGGPTSFAMRTRWFRGVVDPTEGVARLVASDGSHMDLEVQADGRVVRGEVDDAGARARFDLAPSAEGPGGLYSVVDGGCRTGVIVAGTADAPRLQGTWCGVAADGASIFAQVTPILPLARNRGLLRVEVHAGDVTRVLEVEPVDGSLLR